MSEFVLVGKNTGEVVGDETYYTWCAAQTAATAHYVRTGQTLLVMKDDGDCLVWYPTDPGR